MVAIMACSLEKKIMLFALVALAEKSMLWRT